ncbi:GMC oxidoreductase [Ruegeria atlantica]|uniref:GMC oxidoreductase n=1 Tax=Ruegeria atlantica TaxID=81569 RepID=UPI00147A254D|nr:GMC family oxidoreductase [Ruegeria atlantica]
MSSFDYIIVGSGIGGATLAYALAPSGANIVILERGEHLKDCPEARDLTAIFKKGFFRSDERWFDAQGQSFSPGNFYNVGGNSKFFGCVMYRYRESDFTARALPEGETVAWPFGYDELEPWYVKAEQLFQVRGTHGVDPTDPPSSAPLPRPAVPYEPQLRDAAARLEALGLHPSPLPLSVDVEKWLSRSKCPWDGVPDTHTGKIDAETGPLDQTLAYPNVSLITGCQVTRLEADPTGRRIEAVHYVQDGEAKSMVADRVVLAAGAVNSAILLQRSEHPTRSGGLANSSGAVGRYFMNHNTTAMITYDLRKAWKTIHSKVFGLNDFYLNDEETGLPLGNVQQLGKISAPVLAANIPVWMPKRLLQWFCDRAVDWYVMSEDFPSPDSRVYPEGDKIVLDWRPSNVKGHKLLVQRMRQVFRKAGYQLILTKPFGSKSPSHQCGTVRMGSDPKTAPLDPFCKAYDHDNLWVVDASFLPSSAAVNPSLTIAAQALRVGDHLVKSKQA